MDAITPLPPIGQLETEARQFHLANPQVWRLVIQYAEQAKLRGFSNFAIDNIWGVIRWECQLAVGPEHKFKMPNNHRAYYARWYNKRVGEKFFKEYRLRSLGGGSYDRYGREESDIPETSA